MDLLNHPAHTARLRVRLQNIQIPPDEIQGHLGMGAQDDNDLRQGCINAEVHGHRGNPLWIVNHPKINAFGLQ